MNDATIIVGAAGTGLTYSLGQFNEVVALCAGVLTCTYLIWKLVLLYKNGKE
jgi:hypothetical protein